MRKVPARLAAGLYSAADLIAERGIADAKIDEIADASGIPKATLYYYFTGKDEILAFLLHDMLDLVAGEVGVAVAAPGTASQRLRGAVEAQLEAMLKNPGVCRAVIGDLGRATRLPELATAVELAFHQPIAALLKEGAEDGSLRSTASPEATALHIFGAVTVAGLTGAVQGLEHDASTAAHAIGQAVCDLVFNGLAMGDLVR